MVDEELKVIFVHIPKTGGESIEQAFGINMNSEKSTGVALKHASLDTILSATGLRYPLEEYLVFTIVRNPYTHLLSFYFYHKYDLPESIGQKFLELEDSFQRFIDNLDQYFGGTHNLAINRENGPHMLSELTCSNRIDERFDLVLKTEELEYGYQLLRERVQKRGLRNGAKKTLPEVLPHCNKHKSRKEREEVIYTPKMNEIVEKYFGLELKKFDYYLPNNLSGWER